MTSPPPPPGPQISFTRKRLLMVYVHGFLGSEESFCDFPFNLRKRIEANYSMAEEDMDIKLFPRFDTKGNNALAVKKLTDWLLLNATTMEYESVILAAHSMGGLLCADAYTLLYRLTRSQSATPTATPETNDQTANSGWLAKSASLFGSITKALQRNPSNPSQSQDNQPPIDPDSIRCLVNIVGIITFDSPFYGLSSTVITSAGTNKVFDAVGSYMNLTTGGTQINVSTSKTTTSVHKKFGSVEEIVEQSAESSTTTTNNGDSVTVVESGVETLTVSDTKALVVRDPNVAETTENPSPKDTTVSTTLSSTSVSWTTMATYAVLGTAAAATVVYTLPIAAQMVPAGTILRGMATQWALNHAEHVRNHAEFLYPLVNSYSEMHTRVSILMSEMQDKKRLHFQAFYLELPPLIQSTSKTSDGSIDCLPDDPLQIAKAPPPRNFCVPPPVAVEHVFTKISSNLPDEIDAHMYMFDSKFVLPHHYETLIDAASQTLAKILTFPKKD